MSWSDEIDKLVRFFPNRQPAWVRYGSTLILVLLSFALRHGVGDLAGPYGFILFVPALVISSLAFGWGAGLFAVVSSAVIDGLVLDWTGPHFHATALAIFVIIGAALVFMSDALRRALQGLHRAQTENQMLLEEMSHRVKNKFAMITSVIALQSRAAPLEARPALEAVARRVHALACVHTHLQSSRHRGQVQMEAYLLDLVAGLREGAGHLRNVAISTDLERLMFPPREATAVGLIVNELVMNCFKYAFPDERPGKISVSLRRNESSILLIVSDDGIGCAPTAPEGMGTGLVSLLAAQLGGTTERTEPKGGGCSVAVRFMMTSEMQRAADGESTLSAVSHHPSRSVNGPR